MVAPRKKGNTPKKASNVPMYETTSRLSPYVAMCLDPVHSEPALPPVALVRRAIPIKQYQEVLLSTDTNGMAGCLVNMRMKGQYYKVTGWSGTAIGSYDTGNDNVEYTSFANNFYSYIPLVCEVRVKYTGSSNAVSGRMYGIVSMSGSSVDLTTFPLEPNGCEEVTSDGISCTWYSTLNVWANPILVAGTGASEWGDSSIIVGLAGGPASITNLLTVGIYLHMAAVPRGSVCGLTPRPSIPDPNGAIVADLLAMNENGLGMSATSLANRDRMKSKKKGHIKDLITSGGKILGGINPAFHTAATVAEALAMLLL